MTTIATHANHVPRQAAAPPVRPAGRYYTHRLLDEQVRLAVERFLAPRRPAKLIDYGCGVTPYRHLIEPYVGSYLGVDLADNPTAALTLTDDGRVPRPDEDADVVLSTQVLEHVLDPALYLAEAHRVLKPGGLLILSTHGVWKHHPHPTDLWRWTSDGLRRIVEIHGLTIRHWAGLMGRGATGVQLFQDAVVPKLTKRLRAPTAFCFQRLCLLADKLHTPAERDADASIYFLVAEKEPAR